MALVLLTEEPSFVAKGGDVDITLPAVMIMGVDLLHLPIQEVQAEEGVGLYYNTGLYYVLYST